MKISLKYTILVFLAGIATGAVFTVSNYSRSADKAAVQTSVPRSTEPLRGYAAPSSGQVAGAATAETFKPAPQLSMPISVGLSRVTKKPFGLKVSPDHSPVDNDIFYGYHTGIDFEVFAKEENADVPITAACDGKILVKSWAKGYGGLLVQSCKLDDEDVTVIYGHMKLDSITAKVGQTLEAGDTIGLLGDGFTKETDGRRKHLHFDIHKGSELDVHGYVATEDELVNWIDPTEYLK